MGVTAHCGFISVSLKRLMLTIGVDALVKSLLKAFVHGGVGCFSFLLLTSRVIIFILNRIFLSDIFLVFPFSGLSFHVVNF